MGRAMQPGALDGQVRSAAHAQANLPAQGQVFGRGLQFGMPQRVARQQMAAQPGGACGAAVRRQKTHPQAGGRQLCRVQPQQVTGFEVLDLVSRQQGIGQVQSTADATQITWQNQPGAGQRIEQAVARCGAAGLQPAQACARRLRTADREAEFTLRRHRFGMPLQRDDLQAGGHWQTA
jgi:hypothetical protein